eukprot:3489040-Amphidinium_carterae.1
MSPLPAPAGMLQALTSPDFKNDSLESWEPLRLQWEAEVFRARTTITAQLQMEAGEFEDNYERLREVLRTHTHTHTPRSSKKVSRWWTQGSKS